MNNYFEEDENFIYFLGNMLPPNRIRYNLDSPVMKFFEELEELKVDEESNPSQS